MELNWSTFVLEIINFLVLVWILKRFLYVPVKAAIDGRQKRIDAALAQAEARRAEADRTKADYEDQKQDWERERAQTRLDLEQEITAERARRIQEIEQESARRQQRADVLDERRRKEAVRRDQEEALNLEGRGELLLAYQLGLQEYIAELVAHERLPPGARRLPRLNPIE